METQNDKINSQNVSVLRALNKIKNTKKYTTHDVLLDCRIEPCPSGITKLWEIRLRFFHVRFRVAGFMIGKPLKGSFTCHRQGNFVTYCVTIKEREYWFDQYELALNALSNETLLFDDERPRVNV
jgi:hypothetical protein